MKQRLLIHCAFAVVFSLFWMSGCKTVSVRRNEDLPARVSLNDAEQVLRHLLYGSVPEYNDGEEARILSLELDDLLTEPEFCFARSNGSDTPPETPLDAFVTNTKEFLIPFAQGVKKQPLIKQEFLDEAKTVEQWIYGNEWFVVVNFGEENYQYGQTLLPQYGFIAIGPAFLAQHYYSNADSTQTTLVVQDGDTEFYGFR